MDLTDRELKLEYQNELKDIRSKIKKIEKLLKEMDKKINSNKIGILTFRKFTERMQELPDEIVKTKVLKKKNYLIEKIFSNLTVKNKKVVMYQLEEPFATFMKKGFVSKCRDGRTRTDGLTLPKRAL